MNVKRPEEYLKHLYGENWQTPLDPRKDLSWANRWKYIPGAEFIKYVRWIEMHLKNFEMIVYSYYVLDIVHKGHLHYMRTAKAIAGKDGLSIVGILTDQAVMEKKSRPTVSFEERLDLAVAIRFNDVVVPQETYSPLENLRLICPDAVLESSGHSALDINKVKAFMHTIHGKVFVIPYYSPQSSTKIKALVRQNET